MIKLVEKGFTKKVVSLVVPRLVRQENQQKLSTLLDKATKIGQNTSAEGIIAALEAMRERPDRSQTLQKASFEFLWISGAYDSFYPPTKAESFLHPAPHKHIMLQASAHAAFLEETKQCEEVIKRFLLS
jgi:pimeloyl-ACP methyl ester carboxylesterase